MITPQELVERGLAASRSDACCVLVHESESANLRWANNTLTTNGVMASRRATIVAQRTTGDGTAAAGVVTGPAASAADVLALVERADAASAEASPAEDANPIADGSAADDWDQPAATTSISIFDTFAGDLGEVLTQARGEQRLLYGYAEH